MTSSTKTRALLWMLALALAGSALRAAAVGALAAPPMTSLDALVTWVDDRTAGAAAVALVRAGAEYCTWYLLALSALHGAVALGGRRRGGRVLEVVALPGTSRLVRAGIGLGLVASSTLADTGTPPDPSSNRSTGVGTATMRPIVEEAREGVATMRPITDPPTTTAGGAGGGGTGGTATMRPARPAHTAAEPAPGTHTSPWPASWTVTRGESLWTIASELLAERGGREPSDVEIDPFWRRLIEVNRHRLVDPAVPDLIVPGQVLEVPVPPGQALTR